MNRFKLPVIAAVITTMSLLTACSQTSGESQNNSEGTSSGGTIDTAAPALADYNTDIIENNLWQRTELAARDRSLITVAAMVTKNQSGELPDEIARAMDNGLEPAAISETITHLAFYSSWPNGLAAARVAGPVFEQRGVEAADLPSGDVTSLEQDQVAEAQRAAGVQRDYGQTAPGVVEFTTDTLFGDLWLRPDLTPRDRSVVTVAALVAAGQTGQIPFHLGRALDNGLTPAQASETLTHLAFYAGWPNVFSAMPIFRDVLAAR
ncbi:MULTISPECIES: carboxymuconolactone decarboxylase family protein [unclassified Rhodococcus (in: high G+C Gram-positive bacteria)]|uniref:carboxymuconolactone decarboxylase family protein n=1 Tax=unclassified Rhodococcus (in: high G+C Gram-positive bacteria) TaxID=192944 RepID=UPI000B9B9BA9|nr:MULTISPECIES: carboxymuconolactone decarboxylase family protein [unclassified Rhodococcus (in: high G+C Gram-positive bacteria)]OZE37599.1 4-carboxymuconolactone decarboxylase [Rhodococcus sp. 05-2254-4]OZE40731.1 4-carboxymuconolactone decarboxylase [Rhodococcus sp. 05-2254-3]OZE45722.1 4-carboxymuconolactone decarboxylase [Rhodococcus sp. 05-2254-2]